jgi:hypothetical protein
VQLVRGRREPSLMGDGGLLVDHASELGCERPIWWWRRWSEDRPGTRRSRCTRRVPPAEGLDDVALRVLGLRAPDRPGIVAIPIGERTDLDVAAVGLLIALSPGRLLVDVERRVMLFHVIDAAEIQAVRAR